MVCFEPQQQERIYLPNLFETLMFQGIFNRKKVLCSSRKFILRNLKTRISLEDFICYDVAAEALLTEEVKRPLEHKILQRFRCIKYQFGNG